MHLLYVDESGDTGRSNPENHTFVLCGLLVHHADWHRAQANLDAMRSRMHEAFGLPKKAEIHASELLGRSAHHFKMTRLQRVKAALHLLETLRGLNMITAIRIIIDKRSTAGDVLVDAWTSLLGEAKAKIDAGGNIRCSAPGLLVICDDHRTAPASSWLNQVQVDIDIGNLLADQPFGRDSRASDWLQACDLLAYLTKQACDPTGYFQNHKSRWLTKRCERYFHEQGRTISKGERALSRPLDRNLGGS
jgi:hypothetical protein